MTASEEEPVWAQTLRVLYENGMQDGTFDEYGYSELARQHAIAEELNKRPVEVARALRSMEGLDLIDGVPSNRRQGYTLTEKGFSVAHSRSLRRHEQELEDSRNKRQHNVNRAIGFLTLGLVLVGLIQATVSALRGNSAPLWETNAVLGVGVLVVVVIGLLLWQSGLLSERKGNNNKKEL